MPRGSRLLRRRAELRSRRSASRDRALRTPHRGRAAIRNGEWACRSLPPEIVERVHRERRPESICVTAHGGNRDTPAGQSPPRRRQRARAAIQAVSGPAVSTAGHATASTPCRFHAREAFVDQLYGHRHAFTQLCCLGFDARGRRAAASVERDRQADDDLGRTRVVDERHEQLEIVLLVTASSQDLASRREGARQSEIATPMRTEPRSSPSTRPKGGRSGTAWPSTSAR